MAPLALVLAPLALCPGTRWAPAAAHAASRRASSAVLAHKPLRFADLQQELDQLPIFALVNPQAQLLQASIKLSRG